MRELRCQVAVVGAGPAGLAAAAAACERGADVLVLDEAPAAGGQIWREARGAGPRPEARRLRARAGKARFLAGATVVDALSPSRLVVQSRDQEATCVHADTLVLATGATELFLPFPGWTLPGVFGVGGLQALVKGGFDVRGKRVLIAGSGPLLLAVAASLVKAGAVVLAVLEQASRTAVVRFGLGLAAAPAKLAQAAGLAATLRRVPVHHGAWVLRAEGDGAVARVQAMVGGRARSFDVDVLATAFGLVPATQLGELLGCARGPLGLAADDDLGTSVAGVFAAGEITGIGGVDAALAEGALAGHAAAVRALGARGDDAPVLRRARARVAAERRFAARLARAFALRPELRVLADDTTLVCRCEDVPLGALRGFDDAREAKLATRCGMGPCQARVCGPALAHVLGWARERPRPPLVPVPFTLLAALGDAEPTDSP